jgi:hypothetical protein
MKEPNKLDHLSMASQIEYYWVIPEPTQVEHHSGASLYGNILFIPANIRLELERLANDKRSSLFCLFAKDGK